MTVYRVVNETGYKEAEYAEYSSAMREAVRLGREHRPAHYRVEQVDIVYHTAADRFKDRIIKEEDSSGD